MACKTNKYPENTNGRYYVDKECIACDACIMTAPKFFSMHDSDGHAFVSKQPESPEDEALCKEALEGCPVEAIGSDGEN